MNVAAVRVAVADRIEAADVDALPERAFTLSVAGPPQRLDYMQCVAYAVELTAFVYYSAAPGVEDRMADDAQAMTSALFGLHTESADIWDVNPSAQPPAELDGSLGLPFSIVVKYLAS